MTLTSTDPANTGGDRRPLLLGHRGASRYAPENTIAAFELALEHGCDGIEFDVRRTTDGRAVITHDATVSGHDVAHSTYGELLAIKPSLPTLDGILERFACRGFLYIELKVGGLENEVASMLRVHQPEHGFVIASFLLEVIAAVRACDPSLPTGLIYRSKRDTRDWRESESQFIIPRKNVVSKQLVEEIHAAGKRVLTWTVNKERDMRRVAEAGVDGMMSDDTALLGRVFGRDR